jgi:hypothetical protein
MNLEELGAEFGFPIAGVIRGEPIPDLSRIDRERWTEVLTSLSPEVADRAVYAVPGLDQRLEALDLWLTLPPRPIPERRPPRFVPPPRARRPPQRARQVNVRLYRRDFRTLEEAAELAGTTPTQLARWFIVSGARRMAYEERAAVQSALAPKSSS